MTHGAGRSHSPRAYRSSLRWPWTAPAIMISPHLGEKRAPPGPGEECPLPDRGPMKPIRKAIFPVAGLGTRFLPATKAMPKEMLPVVDRPLIQHVVDEAREA